MINKRFRAGLKKLKQDSSKMRFTLGTLTLVTICIMLLIIATFTQIKINCESLNPSMADYLKFEYVPQVPAVIFIASLLGSGWGLLTVLLYIILGLTPFFPIFALGGGPNYIFQYNFGYIFAYIFSVLICAKELKDKPSFTEILKAVLYGILIIHIIGTFYMIIIALIRHDSFDFMLNWIYFQSVTKILFDVVFSFIAVFAAIGLKKILWVIFA